MSKRVHLPVFFDANAARLLVASRLLMVTSMMVATVHVHIAIACTCNPTIVAGHLVLNNGRSGRGRGFRGGRHGLGSGSSELSGLGRSLVVLVAGN